MPLHRIHMLLDKSGSMDAYRQQTIDAVNGYLAAVRADALAFDTAVSLTTFDSHSIDAVRRGERGSTVRNLQPSEFEPRAATPLYDAVAHVLDVESRMTVPGRRAIVVVTDGAENGSRRYDEAQVRNLVAAREREGWIFIFLGANQNATVEAAKVGIPERRAISYRASSGASAVETFTAAAAVSFAYFMLKPDGAGAATVGFTEANRQVAFDGEVDWRSEMQSDIAGAPTEPPAGDLPAVVSEPITAESVPEAERAGDADIDASKPTEDEGGIGLEDVVDVVGAVISGLIGLED